VTRITVDVNDGWLEAARAELGADTKAATINAALHAFAIRSSGRTGLMAGSVYLADESASQPPAPGPDHRSDSAAQRRHGPALRHRL
jgi:hypothetical protein